jgi:hypothetical protein
MVGYGSVVSPGWSLGVWVNLRALPSAAHLFSAQQTGGTLRVSVNAATALVEVVDNLGGRTCTGATPVPLYVWTLVALTQFNTSSEGASSTVIYVNGQVDSTCSNMIYWNSPAVTKSIVYIGFDSGTGAAAVLQATLAQWSFWYGPLQAADHLALYSNPPVSIAGPLPVTLFPPPEAGVPLLALTPRVYTILPISGIRDTAHSV